MIALVHAQNILVTTLSQFLSIKRTCKYILEYLMKGVDSLNTLISVFAGVTAFIGLISVFQ